MLDDPKILTGHPTDADAALDLLKQAVASRNSDTPPDPQIDEFLAELILQQWGGTIEARREAVTTPPPGEFALPVAAILPSTSVVSPDWISILPPVAPLASRILLEASVVFFVAFNTIRPPSATALLAFKVPLLLISPA